MSIKIFESAKIIGRENIEFGTNIIIDDFVFIYAKNKMKIGNYVHIACFSSIAGGEYFEMGDFSGISQGVRIFTASDDFKDWGFGNPTISEEYRNVTRGEVKIGKFSIIGANSVILPNVTIGEGVSVGANSVVSKDLLDWGIYVGNRRVAERNKEGVYKTYNKFLENNK
ncbi:MAG: acyltransferase [Alphaproteobacteria bacterium]